MCSFAALGTVLPCAEKMDKAKVLVSTVSYIKELQVSASFPDLDSSSFS